MSTFFECDWCGRQFDDRAQVASVDLTIGSQNAKLHCCPECAPGHVRQHYPEEFRPLNDPSKLTTDGGEPVATARPDREDYPDPSLVDLRRAIEAALADVDTDHPWRHHRRGRYTAHRTYTEHDPDGKPGEKHVAIRVEECERDIIMDVPEAHAQSVIDVLDHRLAGAEPSDHPAPEQFAFEKGGEEP